MVHMSGFLSLLVYVGIIYDMGEVIQQFWLEFAQLGVAELRLYAFFLLIYKVQGGEMLW